MKRLIPLGLGLFVVCAMSGCGDTSKHDAVMKEMVDTLEEYAKVLEGITDAASAKRAAGEIDKVRERFLAIGKRAKELPKLTRSQDDSLTNKYKPQMEKLNKRLYDAGFSAGRKAGNEPELQAAMMRLQETLVSLGQQLK